MVKMFDVSLNDFFFTFLKGFYFIFRQKGKEGEREGKKH